MGKVLIEYSTKGRVRTLARSLAALLDQSCQDFDVLVINDQPTDNLLADQYFANWWNRLLLHHQGWIIPGMQVDQAHNHNIPLWADPWRDYELILRADDDVLPNRNCLAELLALLDSNPRIAATAGLWFENEKRDGGLSDRAVPETEVWEIAPDLRGDVGASVTSNWPQRVYHFNRGDRPFQQQHMYSACLYRTEAMRRAGGWPQVYTPGVAHGEETDGTYRLHLAGHTMLVNPKATGQHLKSGGGIRLATDVSLAQFKDGQKWLARLPELEQRNFTKPITVGVWCQHPRGIGGAQRLFYHTLALLQQVPGLTVYPIFQGEHLTPSETANFFHVGYRDTSKHAPAELDVLLQFGHDLSPDIWKSGAKIEYVFYPDKAGLDISEIKDFRQILTLSLFSADAINHRWGLQATPIYPPVKPIKPLAKQKWIMFSGRLDEWKAPLWLMERFVEMNLEGWEFHVVAAGSLGVYLAYEDQCRNYVKQHPNIVLHENVSQDELESIYGHASILWTAKGMYCTDDFTREAEHYGYTPLEAMSAGCVPLAFDFGGHRETTPAPWRWQNAAELKALTLRVMADLDNQQVLALSADMQPFSEEEYLAGITRAIYQANALAVELRPYTESGAGIKTKPKVLCISDSPRRMPNGSYTGFGIVSEKLNEAFLEAGFRVNVVARYDYRPGDDNRYESWWPCYPQDYEGMNTLPAVISAVKPDIMFVQYDPGSLTMMLDRRDMSGGGNTPVVAYFPIEGVPIAPGHVRMVNRCAAAVCYTRFGMDEIKKLDPEARVDYAHPGLDHGGFRQLPPADRDLVRRLVGWDDRFVIGAVATNKRTKGWPYLIEIARLLKAWGQTNFIIYAHTNPEEPILQGYPLMWMVERAGVQDVFRFPTGGGAPYDEQAMSLTELRNYTAPPMPEQRQKLFSLMPMAYRYNALDLYLDISYVEGWGLPPLEAMKCGVPVVATHDRGAKDEAFAGGAYWTQPMHWDTWHTGVRLWLPDPETIANAVVKFRQSQKLRQEWIEKGLACAEQYKWQPTQEKFVGLIRGR